MSFAFTFFISLFASWLIIPILIRHSTGLGLMDHPTLERKAHSKSISRAGGIGIVIASYLAIFLNFTASAPTDYLLICGAIIALFGLLDDSLQLAARWKFAGQIVAIVIAISGGVVFDDLPLIDRVSTPDWLRYLFSFLFLLGVTNAVNMTDGLDGLAGGSTLLSLALIAALSYFSGNYTLVIIAAAIMGGISGFVRYNTHPAQVFMGDCGSQFIGFMAAGLALLTIQDTEISTYSAALPILIMGLPILDTIYVVFIRLLNKRSPFSADSNHLHHRLIRLDLPPHEAVALIYIAQTALMLITFQLSFENDLLVLLCYVVFCASLVGLIIVAKHYPWRRKSREVRLSQKRGGERRNPLFRHLGDYFDGIAKASALMVVGAFAASVAVIYAAAIKSNTLGMICAVSACFSALIYTTAKDKQAHAVARLCSSAAISMLFVVISYSNIGSQLRYAFDGYLLLLIALLVLCVRITREYMEMLTTQDLLIFCILVIMPFMPLAKDNLYLAMRIMIAVYAVEYLLANERQQELKTISLGSIAGLSAMAAVLLYGA